VGGGGLPFGEMLSHSLSGEPEPDVSLRAGIRTTAEAHHNNPRLVMVAYTSIIGIALPRCCRGVGNQIGNKARTGDRTGQTLVILRPCTLHPNRQLDGRRRPVLAPLNARDGMLPRERDARLGRGDMRG
jgi:hypothetical protein